MTISYSFNLNVHVVSFPFKVAAQSQEISSLEDTVAVLREDYERCLSANTVSQRDLQENLISSKHELLRVQEQLALAEKVWPAFTFNCPVIVELLRRLVWVNSASLQLLSRVRVCCLQELEKKFQQTAAYRNMKEILTKKNEQIKEIRKRLQR